MKDSRTVKLGICGLGTVGSGTVNLLASNGESISRKAGVKLEIIHVGARRDNPACDLSALKVSRDIFAVVDDPEVDIVIELIGGTTVAKELVIRAIKAKKHVVTANKALIAEFGTELFALAAEAGVALRYEAAVAGGIPIIKALREGLAGNDIRWLAGIINGTTNFILTEMESAHRSFADVLAQAQELGYAEADPTFDIEGIDAGHKLVILAAIAFGMPLDIDGVYTEGMTTIAPADLVFARELGYRIKHLGIARLTDEGVNLRVHPTLIPDTELLSRVNGVENAVLIDGSAVGPTLYCGAGAGAAPTASAVVADVIDIARELAVEQLPQVSGLGVAPDSIESVPIIPMARVVTPWYLRVTVCDRPGVMSRISSILSEHGISIEALIQKPAVKGESSVSVVVLTNRASQSQLLAAVAQIEALDTTMADVIRIRVDTLKA
ncbi:MAG: homoserine dehydrogenase [Proteobacteria bacterium]|nr:homoserine dehydrogenase [Pseudomonadota bacterium]